MGDDDRRTHTATVVGGGPAGLMAAEVLANSGVRVTVHDHMPSVGRKLLLAGRGGLNITHSEPFDDMLRRYGPAAPRLSAALQAFGPSELRAWSETLGEPTFIGTTGRVFPKSFRATPLLRSWISRLAGTGVEFQVRDLWRGWALDDRGMIDPRTSRFERNGAEREESSDVTLLAMGGASWPRVGSDGGWVRVLTAAGIDVNALRPSNCGIVVPWTAEFRARFAGTPVKNAAISVGAATVRGDVMITDGGMEAGPVYTHSAAIRDSIDTDGACTITVDLQPDLAVDEVARRLAARRPKESLAHHLRRAVGLGSSSIALLREATANHLPDDAAALAHLIKSVPFEIRETMPITRAISSAGGIALREVDDRFMITRLPGTFVAGEMLDWEAPTGGYLLQATFSTAVAAANGAISWLAERSP